MTLQKGVALQLLLKLGNHKPCRSDFHVVCKPNNEACRWHYQQMNCLGHKEETCILVSVAKLLRLRIIISSHGVVKIYKDSFAFSFEVLISYTYVFSDMFRCKRIKHVCVIN